MEKRLLRDAPYEHFDIPAESRWARLPLGVRVAAGAGALLIPIAGVMAGLSTMTVTNDAEPRSGAALAGKPAPPAQAGGAPSVATPGDTTSPDPAGGDEDSGPWPRHGAAAGPTPAAASAGQVTQTPPTSAVRAVQKPPTGKPAAARDPRGTGTVAGSASITAARPMRVTPPPPAAPPVVHRPPATAPAEPVAQTVPHEIPNGIRLVQEPSVPLGVKHVDSPATTAQQTFHHFVTALKGHRNHRGFAGTRVIRQPRNLDARPDIRDSDDDRCDFFCFFVDATPATDLDFLSGLWMTAAPPAVDLNFGDLGSDGPFSWRVR